MKKIITAIPILTSTWACREDCKDLRVPYWVKVPYTEYVSVEKKLSYRTGNLTQDRKDGYELDNSIIRWEYRKPYWEASIMVTNTSAHDGYFGFFVTWECLGQELVGTSSSYIAAGTSKLLEIKQEVDHNTFWEDQTTVKKFEVIPPLVRVNEARTKYRKEKRYRHCNTCEEDCRPARD